MKIRKGNFVALGLALLLASCATTNNTEIKGKTKVTDPHVKPSQHLEIPSTASTIVTEPQEMNESLTALEFSKLLGNGINLGNTMEAYRSSVSAVGNAPTSFERLWGQPITTKEMVAGYKQAGFDTLRIPVAWTNAMNFESGNYIINRTYIDRIEEIVNYALDSDMYVIVNDHWDGGWWGMFGSNTPEIRESAMDLYVSLWTQIGERFKNYSYKLIFESGNEEIGSRLNDKNICWDSGTLSEDDCYRTAYKINQKFVDTIRNQGGNNASRFLLIAGYNTDVSKTCDNRFKMPEDKVKDRLFLSVHYYDPSPLCIGKGDDWGSKEDIKEMNAMLKKLTKFTDKGYGVIIGEYGVLPEGKLYKSGTKIWHENFLDNCDLYNYCPVLWDTGDACFYSKTEKKLRHEEIALMYTEYSYENQKDTAYDVIQKQASERMYVRLNNAASSLVDNALEGRDDIGIAYIMYADKSWSVNYSVGDQYKPASKTKGVEAEDVGITKEGDYTVKLDFTGMKDGGKGSSSGFSFAALGIANGERLFPGWVIEITEIKVNGKSAKMTKKNYTSSDDGKCTRSNIVNDWVPDNSVQGRTVSGNIEGCSATIIDKNDLIFSNMKTLEISFHYGPAM